MSNFNYCPECGTKSSPGNNFCGKCGASLSISSKGTNKKETQQLITIEEDSQIDESALEGSITADIPNDIQSSFRRPLESLIKGGFDSNYGGGRGGNKRTKSAKKQAKQNFINTLREFRTNLNGNDEE